MTRASAGPAVVEQEIPVIVRALQTTEDYAACVRLQRETWGEEFADYVPASLLKVAQMIGGVTVGAFTPEGRLVGFVFGMTGVQEGRLVHWSHMLAVERGYRDHGLGRRLKESQRELLHAEGIETIYWTFDPLVARNAHLNLNRLGTTVREYVPDMYGATGSPLHNFGTDRFVVAWRTSPNEPVRVSSITPAWRQAPVVSGALEREVAARIGNGDGPLIRIEVPADIEQISVTEAREWRMASRSAFVRLLNHGYDVIGFYTENRKRCYYVLARTGEADER